MGFSEIQIFMSVLLAICACVVAVSGAIAAIVKFWKWAHRQSDENQATINDIMKWLASDKHRIEDLETSQAEMDKQNKLLLKAIVSLMSHELDGNHTEQIAQTRDEIQNYLIEK